MVSPTDLLGRCVEGAAPYIGLYVGDVFVYEKGIFGHKMGNNIEKINKFVTKRYCILKILCYNKVTQK